MVLLADRPVGAGAPGRCPGAQRAGAQPATRSCRRRSSADAAVTARPGGFAHLPQQVRDGTAWQFALTGNNYGGAHGLLTGGAFHVVWLDCNHNVYPHGMNESPGA